MLLLLITLLTSCTLTDSTAVADSANVCELALTQMAPEAALPGETIQLVLSPLTTADDTLVTIGGVRAQLQSFERAGCADCDACRDAYLCAPCLEDCDVCDLGCEPEPKAMDWSSCKGEVTPSFLAMLSTGSTPTSPITRTVTVFLDKAKARRRVMLPR